MEIEISFIGFKTQVIKVSEIKNKSKRLKINLIPDKQSLDEVIVTGYNNISKKSFTGSSVNVKNEEIIKTSPGNMVQALQMFDPSLKLADNSEFGSNPNKIPEFYMRGKTSIGIDVSDISRDNLSNNPNMPTFIMDGYEVSLQKVYDLDPQRIESLTVLKDAAATAIYGSRATNGVIIITTKAPAAGKLTVNYVMNLSVTTPDLSDYNLYGSRGKLELERKAGAFDYYGTGIESEEYYERLEEVNRGIDTYWLSKPLRTAINTNQSIYLEGGGKGLRFGLNLRDKKNKGVMKGSYRNNSGMEFTLQYSIGNLLLKNTMGYNTMDSEESPYGSFSKYTQINSISRPKDNQGNYYIKLPFHGNNPMRNPLYDATLDSYNKSEYKEFTNNFSAQYIFNESLRIKGTYSYTDNASTNNVFTDPKSSKYLGYETRAQLKKGEKSFFENKRNNWDANVLLIFNNKYGDHNLNFVLGANAKETNYSSSGFNLEGFPTGTMDDNNFAATIVGKPSGFSEKTRLLGTLFSSNYTFKDIYLFDATYRIDGGSQFGTKKKFASFYAFGLGLNIHNYAFIDAEWLNQLKIRGTFGQTGKTNFPASAAQTMYRYNTTSWYISGNGTYLESMGNEDLKWETTNSYEGGMDISLFNNAITVTANYYDKRTKDLIAAITIPSSTGFTSFRGNLGEVSNKGYEVLLRSNIINREDLNFSVYGSISSNKNEILKISDAMKDYNKKIDENQKSSYNTKPVLRFREGASLTSIYAMKSLGINPVNGKEILLDRDGNITYDWAGADNVVCGDTEPTAMGTFGFNVSHKGLSLYTGFRYRFGGQIYNQTLVDKVESADIRWNVDTRVGDSRWLEMGDVTTMKRLRYGGIEDTYPSSRFVQDDNTLSLSSVSLAYIVPSKLISKLGLSQLRVQANAQDLFNWSSIKQERGISYPYSRTFTFTLNASF